MWTALTALRCRGNLEGATKEREENVPIKHNIADAIHSMVLVVSEVPKLILKTPLAILDEMSALSKVTEQDLSTEGEGGWVSPHSIRAGAVRDSTYTQRTILGASGVATLFGAIHCKGGHLNFHLASRSFYGAYLWFQ